MATKASVPAWVPSDEQGVISLPSGRDWDAVQVSARVAGRVLDALQGYYRPRSGSVLVLPGTWVWFIELGGASSWRLGHGVSVIRPGAEIPVPPASWTCFPGPHWYEGLPAGTLTDAWHLSQALGAIGIPQDQKGRRA